MIVLGLYALMLVLMLMRVAVPIGARVDGKVVARYPLGFRERLALQRTNVYLVGSVLLLGSLAGWLPTILELFVLVGVFGILTIPARYTLTTDGIALNQVVFRSWTEFQTAEATPRGIQLAGKPGRRDFSLYLPVNCRPDVLRLSQRLIAGSPIAHPRKGVRSAKAAPRLLP